MPTKKVSNRLEIGNIGRSNSALFQYSLSTDEYLQTLTWPNYISIYEKMKRSDAQVKAMLLMLELPLRSTQWYIEPYDKSANATKIKEFIEANLFEGPPNGMQIHWDDMLRNICTMFAFGHSIFEKVYEVGKDGYLKWKKFAPRPQATIYDFLYEDNGDPKAIIQTLYNRGFTQVEIPIDKILLFSHRAENGDIRGSSALRAAYKHWSIKDFLYKIINIGIERNHIGTPQITLPPNASPEDVTEAKKIVTTLRSADLGGAVIPSGFLLELFEGKRNMTDIMPYLQHQDLMIVRSVLAQFINLGSTDTGSYALSEDQSDMFLMLLNAEAKYICNTFNATAIPQLVGYNFNTDQFPKLCFKPLGGKDNKIFEILKLLVDGGLVIPDKNIEEWLRDMLELPEKTEESYEVKQERKDNSDRDTNDDMEDEENKAEKVDDSNDKSIDSAKEQANKDDEDKAMAEVEKTKWWRSKKPEEEGINFDELDTGITDLENAFKADGKKIIVKIVKDLSEKAQKTDKEKLSTIPVRYKSELTNFVFSHMEDSIKFGVKTQTGEESIIDATALKANAAIIANNIAERTKSRFLFIYMSELTDKTILKAAKAAERMMLNANN